MKHQWINKRTPKDVKPVREWLECKNCGVVRDGEQLTHTRECVK